jgi:hypothetical protein
MKLNKYLKYKKKYLNLVQHGGINSDSLLDDYIRDLSTEQWKELLDKTDKYILELTEGRVGDNPYWDVRVVWIQNMLAGRFCEPLSVKQKIIMKIDEYDIPFDFIINMLYSYMTCLKELSRSTINENKTFEELILVIRKLLRREILDDTEKKLLDKKIYTGQSIKDCLLKNTRVFNKLIKHDTPLSRDVVSS